MAGFAPDNFDPDQARYDRLNKTKRPEFLPGQSGSGGLAMSLFDDTNNGSENLFSDGVGTVDSSSSFNAFNSPSSVFNTGTDGFSPSFNQGVYNQGINQGGYGSFNSGYGQNSYNIGANSSFNAVPQQPQAVPEKSDEDKFYEIAGKIFTTLKEATEKYIDVLQSYSLRGLANWGSRMSAFSGVAFVIGLLLYIVGLPAGIDIAIGSCISAVLGIFLMFIIGDMANKAGIKNSYKTEAPKKSEPISEPAPQMQQPMQQSMQQPMQTNYFASNMGSGDSFFNSPQESDNSWGDDSDYEYDDDEYTDTSSSSSSSSSEDTEYDPFAEGDIFSNLKLDEVSEKGEAGMDTDEAFDSLPEITAGMYTRQYLYEQFSKVLDTMTPDFNKPKYLEEGTKDYEYWYTMVSGAVKASGVKDEIADTVELKEVQEKTFIIKLKITRHPSMKGDLIAEELAKAYAYRIGVNSVSFSSKAILQDLYITLFKDVETMVSLKDMMLQSEDFLLDTKNYIPIIFGVDEEGNVLKSDIKNIDCLLVAGEPRSGKSWFVKCLITQMCAYLSPKELNFYVCDPKAESSDFASFCLPHVKKFESDQNKILDVIRYVVKKEGPRRKKIIGSYLNIWNFKEANPDYELPLIYLIIDEVITISGNLKSDKEAFNEFQTLLRELVTQFPAFGIRGLFIPHRINNSIIEKNTTDNIPCRISVLGNAEHIEHTTGAKPKDFPYTLYKKGEMAIKIKSINAGNVAYARSTVLSDSDAKNLKLFDYLRRCWIKIEPGCDTDAVSTKMNPASQKEEIKENTKVLDSLDIDNLDLDDEELGFNDLNFDELLNG